MGGQFGFHLDGAVGDITFNDAQLVLEGGVCFAEPEGECPME